jgi:hypothetical protein
MENERIFNLPTNFHGFERGFEDHELFAPKPQTAPLLLKADDTRGLRTLLNSFQSQYFFL